MSGEEIPAFSRRIELFDFLTGTDSTPRPLKATKIIVSRKFLLTILALATLALLPACNIVRGVGQDMAAVGRTVAKTADRSGNSDIGEEHSSDVPPAQNAATDSSADYDYGWEN